MQLSLLLIQPLATLVYNLQHVSNLQYSQQDSYKGGRERGVCVCVCERERERERERGREGGREREADWWCSLVCIYVDSQAAQ